MPVATYQPARATTSSRPNPRGWTSSSRWTSRPTTCAGYPGRWGPGGSTAADASTSIDGAATTTASGSLATLSSVPAPPRPAQTVATSASAGTTTARPLRPARRGPRTDLGANLVSSSIDP